MSKNSKLICGVLLVFAGISFLQVWLNIGFDKLGKSGGKPTFLTFETTCLE